MAASVENQKYNTKESVKELVGGLPKQSIKLSIKLVKLSFRIRLGVPWSNKST